MRAHLSVLLTTCVAAVAFAAPSAHGSAEPHQLRARNIVNDIADEYDFVVVGGGLAGLVLGARLSEDANHTVLVLEAGGTGDDVRDQIDIPGNAYYNSLWKTAADWDFKTVPQTAANDVECEWPRGKVLGGSSAINGLYMNRPGKIEISAWHGMLEGLDGADNWSWDSFFAAMKKSETFTPAPAAIAQEAAITWDTASHGTSGPIHQSYPGYTFPYVGQWSTATESVGIADSQDTYGGENWGAYVSTSAINPTNWTRSYSRSGYLDPLPPRSNYAVLANAHVTRLLFNSSSPKGNLSADAVEYTRDAGATMLTVKVKKEVILASGTVGSPTVLLHSGVGPEDVLSAAGVELISKLPGVGQHLQDHVSVSLQWNAKGDTSGDIDRNGGTLSKDAEFLSYINSAVAYVNSTTMFPGGVSDLQSTVLSQLSSYTPNSNSDPTVLAGYKKISQTTANKFLTSPLGIIEMLIGNNVPGSIRIGSALQHPFSHGQITISSANPLDYPVIDPGYLTHPADVLILREALKLTRRVGATSALSSSIGEETWPGKDVQSDAEWEKWLKPEIFTEFHPSSTCAMLPLHLGGVVDANLRVYGLANVRVADASVPPMSFSAHLMGSTYGLAEQASTLIRSWHNRQITVKNKGGGGGDGQDGKGGGNTASANSTTNGNAGSSDKTNDAIIATPSQVWSLMLAITGLFVAWEFSP